MQKVYNTPQMEVVNFTVNHVIAANGELDVDSGIVTPPEGSS